MFCLWASTRQTASQFLARLWPVPPPLLLLHLPQLLHPSHGFGHGQTLRLLEPCVLVKVPMWVINAEPLRQFGMS
jgi:hypothetical protein